MFFRSLNQTIKVDSVPTAMLDNGRLGKILKNEGLVHTVDNDFKRFSSTGSDVQNPSIVNVFKRKRAVGEYLYKSNIGGDGVSLPADRTSKLRNLGDVISVNLDISKKSMLGNKSGLLSHPELTGRESEKPATVSVIEREKVLGVNNVGIRMYGPEYIRSHRGKNLNQSYELFFRSRYGRKELPMDLFFKNERAIGLSGLILDNRNLIQHGLSMELLRLAGIPMPAFSPVWLQVNNHAEGFRIAKEPVDLDQWMLRTGLPHMDFYLEGSGVGDPGWRWYTELASWLRQVGNDITMESANQYLDLESLSRNIALHMYCGSSDWHTWAIYRDRQSDNRWRWIDWDLQTCIVDHWNTSSGPLSSQHWLEVVATRAPITGEWRISNRDTRTLIFVALMRHDPDYPEYFAEILSQLIDQDIDVDFMLAQLEYYRRIEALSDSDSLVGDSITVESIKEFLLNRGQFIKSNLSRITDQGF